MLVGSKLSDTWNTNRAFMFLYTSDILIWQSPKIVCGYKEICFLLLWLGFTSLGRPAHVVHKFCVIPVI